MSPSSREHGSVPNGVLTPSGTFHKSLSPVSAFQLEICATVGGHVKAQEIHDHRSLEISGERCH